MKKLFFMLIAMVTIVAFAAVADADDLGVQIIGSQSNAMETLTLDDMKTGQIYSIDGYGILEPKSFSVVDSFAQYQKGKAGDNRTGTGSMDASHAFIKPDAVSFYMSMEWKDSGESADFLWLVMDITNLQKTSKSYIQESAVKVVFNDDYEFSGWVRQFNYDYNTFVHRREKDRFASPAVLDPSDEEPIGMLYAGSYVFGCTVPNYVLQGKEPLRMEIKIGDNELTYNIRK